MLKDLTKSDWLASLDLAEESIPRVLLLRGTRNLRRHYLRHAALFDAVVEIGSPNALFEDIFIGRREGRAVGYASVYGGSMASEITHVFGALGTRIVIVTGVCGALGDGIEAGDLIAATHAGCGDGASQCYFPGRETVSASPGLLSSLLEMASEPAAVRSGPLWSTAALLAEGGAEIDLWHRQGYIAVDMETAAAFAVAEHFGMQRLSLLSVFDNPREGAHLALTERDKDVARARSEEAMLALLLQMIDENASWD